MNIYACYPDPIKSATILDDSRVIKMVLESCQMLAAAAHSVDRWDPRFPRLSHYNHPCTKWVREGRENFEWLLVHAEEMDAERRRRFGSSAMHKTLASCTRGKIQTVKKLLPSGKTPFVNAARNKSLGIDFTWVADTHEAYRRYLRKRWFTQTKPAVCSIKGLYENGYDWRTQEDWLV